MTAPAWTDGAVWYHVYTLGFCGAEPTNAAAAQDGGVEDDGGMAVEHRLIRLCEWLDHIAGLGVTGLVLAPVFEAETHGYDTVDYRRVDRRLGDEADLVALFDESHRRGLRVVLDGVFNHVGRSFPPFADVVARGSESPFASWFRCRFDGTSLAGCDVFEGHEQLVVLNHDEPQVLDLVVDVSRYWLDRGADGFRLDAAYAVPTRFWRAYAEQVRATHPDAWLLTELIHGDYGKFVERAGVHSATQYELWKAIWSSLNDGNFFELAYALGRHADFAASFVPYTFVGNHDVTRIATQLTDRRHLPHALAVLFTVPGTPAVYYGDEFGLTGEKRHEAGGDDAIRPAFPASADALPAGADPTVADLYRSLIGLRRQRPWLDTATIDKLHLANESYAYMVLGAGAASRLVVALNVGGGEVQVPLPQGSWRTAVSGDGARIEDERVVLDGHAWLIASE